MTSPNVNLFISYVENLLQNKIDANCVRQNIKMRDFYSSNQTFDYLDYVNKGSKEKLDYIAYSGNNEKSKGVFNENGLMSKESIKNLRQQLRKTKSVIWHGVISFTEDFGNQYCNTFEKAYELMKFEMPKFFDRAGLSKKNIIWYAGLHENTDNKHIHFSFFEKAPLRYSQKSKEKCFSNGFINNKAIRATKVSIELKLLNYSKDIVKNRNAITQDFKALNENRFLKCINNLVFSLPTEGRMSYDSENMLPYKKEIDNAINLIIIRNPKLTKEVKEFDLILTKQEKERKDIYARMHQENLDNYKKKYIDDLYRRLGNILLHTVSEIRSQQKKIDCSVKNRLLQKRIAKNKRHILFKQCEILTNLATREIINSFQEYLYKLDEARYKRKQEEKEAYEET